VGRDDRPAAARHRHPDRDLVLDHPPPAARGRSRRARGPRPPAVDRGGLALPPHRRRAPAAIGTPDGSPVPYQRIAELTDHICAAHPSSSPARPARPSWSARRCSPPGARPRSPSAWTASPPARRPARRVHLAALARLPRGRAVPSCANGEDVVAVPEPPRERGRRAGYHRVRGLGLRRWRHRVAVRRGGSERQVPGQACCQEATAGRGVRGGVRLARAIGTQSWGTSRG